MQNFLHEEKIHFFVRFNNCMLLTTSVWKLNSLLANFPKPGLKMMSKNTLSEPQPDSASYIDNYRKIYFHTSEITGFCKSLIVATLGTTLNFGHWILDTALGSQAGGHIQTRARQSISDCS